MKTHNQEFTSFFFKLFFIEGQLLDRSSPLLRGNKESFRKMAVSQLDLEKSQIFQLLKVLGLSGRPLKIKSFPGGASGKEPACQFRRHKSCGFVPLVGKIPRRRALQPTPVFLPEKSHGQRNLAGYRPWSRRVGQD